MRTFIKIIMWLLAAGVVFAAVYFSKNGQPAAEPATEEIRALVSVDQQAQGKVFVCYHDVYALDERTDSTAVKIGNFPTKWDVDTRLVKRKKPVRLLLPGKGDFPKQRLLKILRPEEGNSNVAVIWDVVRDDETCKIYDFSQVPG